MLYFESPVVIKEESSINYQQSIINQSVMKKLDVTKKTVLFIGALSTLVGLTGAILEGNLLEFFFPVYLGFTLVGTVVLHREKSAIA